MTNFVVWHLLPGCLRLQYLHYGSNLKIASNDLKSSVDLVHRIKLPFVQKSALSDCWFNSCRVLPSFLGLFSSKQDYQTSESPVHPSSFLKNIPISWTVQINISQMRVAQEGRLSEKHIYKENLCNNEIFTIFHIFFELVGNFWETVSLTKIWKEKKILTRISWYILGLKWFKFSNRVWFYLKYYCFSLSCIM